MKILTVENLSKSFGGIHANRDISFDVEEGSILGVIGPNGAGKSTLFDLIFYGLILMIICIFRPNGLISFIPKDILERKKQR